MKSKNHKLLTNLAILRYNTLDCMYKGDFSFSFFPPFLLGVVAPATPTREKLRER